MDLIVRITNMHIRDGDGLGVDAIEKRVAEGVVAGLLDRTFIGNSFIQHISVEVELVKPRPPSHVWIAKIRESVKNALGLD